MRKMPEVIVIHRNFKDLGHYELWAACSYQDDLPKDLEQYIIGTIMFEKIAKYQLYHNIYAYKWISIDLDNINDDFEKEIINHIITLQLKRDLIDESL